MAYKILKDKVINVRATNLDVIKLDELSLLLNCSKSDVISRALEHYYEMLNLEKVETPL